MAEAKDAGGLPARLKKACAAAALLAQKSDELNRILLDAEEVLASLKLGVIARQVLDEEDASGNETALVFQRWGGKWCLTIEHANEFTGETNTVELPKVSRELRIEAARRLPDLLDRLLEGADSELGVVDTSIRTVAKLVKDLREARS
jgi:hypothetical protein